MVSECTLLGRAKDRFFGWGEGESGAPAAAAAAVVVVVTAAPGWAELGRAEVAVGRRAQTWWRRLLDGLRQDRLEGTVDDCQSCRRLPGRI